MDGGWESGSGNAKANVYPSGQSGVRRTVDAESRLVPQTQTHQQHHRQTRICEFAFYSFQGNLPQIGHFSVIIYSILNSLLNINLTCIWTAVVYYF